VGLIAIVGFGVGILWPRLVGVRLVPSVPSEKADASAAELSGAPVDAAPQASAASPELVPEAKAAPTQEPFSVSPGEVASCRDASGKKIETCDPIDFDAVARGRVATLAACDVSKRVEGVMSLGFELDFEKDRVVGLQSGKSTSLRQADVDDLLACMRRTLGEISLAGIRHAHPRYTVYYKVEFVGSGKPKPALAETNVIAATGKATVAWDVALVRSDPAREAEVVARILQGTRISVTGRSGDWYRVKYDAKSGEGWVFRTAIGM
jgi:hypothetical protein